MKYIDLLEILNEMKPSQLQDDVVVYLNDEYYPIQSLEIADDSNDVLDNGHIYLEGIEE